MASSSLGRQLAALQAKTGARRERGRDSLLFHALEASDVDLETIAGMASNGVVELMQVDTRLQFLRDELLAPSVVHGRRREMQTASENAAMDKLVLRGLRLLGPYFTLPAAHKVMEYLIRRFGVNRHLVDGVMECVLPSHDSAVFGRMMQVVQLTPRWAFLKGVAHTGTPLPRSVIVEQCRKDPALLVFIATMTEQRCAKEFNFRHCLAFAVAVFADLVAATPDSGRDTLLRRLLPFVLTGLRAEAIHEFQQAAYLLVCRIAATGALSTDLWTTMQGRLAAHATATTAQAAVRAVVTMTTLQSEFAAHAMSPKTVTRLLAIPRFDSHLLLTSTTYDAAPFLSAFLPALVRHVSGTDNALLAKITVSMVNKLCTAEVVPALVLAVVQSAAKQSSDKRRQLLAQVLNALTRFAAALDEALGTALRACDAGVATWVASVFAGTAHQVIAAPKAAGRGGRRDTPATSSSTATTLATALAASASQQDRCRALDSLLEVASAGSSSDGAGVGAGAGSATAPAAASTMTAALSSPFIQAAVLARLQDKAAAVVRRAAKLYHHMLRARLSAKQPPPAGEGDELFSIAATALAKFTDAARTFREATAAVRALLALVATPLVGLWPHTLPRVAALLVSYFPLHLAAASKPSRIEKDAVALAVALPVPLFAKLAGDATAVVDGCAQSVVADPEACLTLLQSLAADATAPTPSTWFALAVAASACRAAADDRLPHIASWVLATACQLLSTLPASTPTTASAPAADAFRVSHVVTAPGTSSTSTQVAQLALHRASFLSAALQAALGTLEPSPAATFHALRADIHGTAAAAASSTVNAAPAAIARTLVHLLAAAPAWAMASFQPCISAVMNVHMRGFRLRAAATLASATGLIATAAQQASTCMLAPLTLAAVRAAADANQVQAALGVAVPALFVAAAAPATGARKCALAVLRRVQSAATDAGAPAACAPVQLATALVAATADVLSDSGGSAVRRTLSKALASAPATAASMLRLFLHSNAQCADLVLAAASDMPLPSVAPHAVVLVNALSDTVTQLVALAKVGRQAPASQAAMAARLARLISRLFSADASGTGTDAGSVSALLDVIRSSVSHDTCTTVCNLAAPGDDVRMADARGPGQLWVSPASLVASVVTAGVMRRIATVCGVAAAGDVFTALMSATEHPDAKCATVCREVLASVDLRMCDVAGYVDRAKLDQPAGAANQGRRRRRATAASEGALDWSQRVTSLLEVLAANLTQGHKASPSLVIPRGVAAASKKRRRRDDASSLQFIGDPQTITSQFVAPLVAIVRAALAAKSATSTMVSATTEYVAQLVFTSLRHAVDALAGRLPPNDAQVAAVLDVGHILQCIEESGSLETRSLGLLVVARVAQLLPTSVVEQLMPMLACLGRSSLHRDDSYSFYVVQQIIEAVVPALHHHGASVGLSGYSLVSAFVKQVDSIPAHRRTALFHSVVVSLGATRDESRAAEASYLFAVVALLLASSPATARDVCHGLFARFTGPQQASNLAQLLNVCRRAQLQQQQQQEQQTSKPSVELRDMNDDSDEDVDDDGDAAMAAADSGDEEAKGRDSVGEDAITAQQKAATGVDVTALLAQLALSAPEAAAPAPLLRLLAGFVSDHLSSDTFLAAIARASSQQQSAFLLQKAYLMLAQQLFQILHLCKLGDSEKAEMDAVTAAAAAAAVSGDSSAGVPMSPAALLFPLLDKLGELMTMSTLLVVVTELMHDADPLVGRYALRFFNNNIESRKETMSVAEVELLLDLLKELEIQLAAPDEAVLNKQTALLSIEIICRHFGEFSSDAFVTLLPHVVALAQPPASTQRRAKGRRRGKPAAAASGTAASATPSELEALRSTALLTLATCVSQLGTKTLPHLPKFMPSLLTTLEARSGGVRVSVVRVAGKAAATPAAADAAATNKEGSAEEQADTRAWVLHSALVSLAVVTERLPQFLSPFLRRVLRCTLHRASIPVTGGTKDSAAPAAVRQAANRVLTQLTANVAARMLLPEFIAGYTWCCTKGPGCLSRMLLMLKDVFATMTSAEVVTQHARCFQFLMQALDYRRVFGGKVGAAAVSSVEGAVCDALVSMVLKMSESQLKPMFVKVCNWVGKATMLESGGDASPAEATARRIAFFRLVEVLACQLRSIFVPYFGYFLQGAVKVLSDGGFADSDDESGDDESGDDNGEEDEEEEEEEEEAKTDKGNVSTQAPATGVVVHEDMTSGAVQDVLPSTFHTLRCLVLSCLHKCFVHDKGGKFIGVKERFEPVMTVLLAELTAPTTNPHSVVGGVEGYSAFVMTYLAPCIGALVAATGRDVFWKPLCHRIFLATRAESIAQRRGALECMSTCFQAGGEDILVMLPEALPYLSELMEDNDAAVEKRAHLVVHELEELSGESLQSYLTQ